MITRAGGSSYVVRSETGKRLSKPLSKGAAAKRLRQIEWFKNHPQKAGKK